MLHTTSTQPSNFRGYLSEDLVSEDDNRGKLRGCV